MIKKLFFYPISFFLLIFKPDLGFPSNTSFPDCSISIYYEKILKGELGPSNFFNSIENHNLDKFGPSCPGCDEICNNLNLNSLYESLLAMEILENSGLRKKFGSIYAKIIKRMPRYNEVLSIWEKDPDYSQVLPVAQKALIKNKRLALEAGNNPALMLDFILYHAKSLDKIGIGVDGAKIRDNFYSLVLSPQRGKRTNAKSQILRKQYGIMKFDVPELEMNKSVPWIHWARDICQIDPNSSLYNINVTKRSIPLACGISGTTVLALFSIFTSSISLSEEEIKLIILSIWSVLCSDGGHSLNEVLASSKIFINYFLMAFKNYKKIKEIMSAPSLINLQKVTSDINAIGDNSPGKFAAYWDSFFSKINHLEFKQARMVAQNKFEKFFKNKCIKLEPLPNCSKGLLSKNEFCPGNFAYDQEGRPVIILKKLPNSIFETFRVSRVGSNSEHDIMIKNLYLNSSTKNTPENKITFADLGKETISRLTPKQLSLISLQKMNNLNDQIMMAFSARQVAAFRPNQLMEYIARRGDLANELVEFIFSQYSDDKMMEFIQQNRNYCQKINNRLLLRLYPRIKNIIIKKRNPPPK